MDLERITNRFFRIVLKCLNYAFLLGVLFSTGALLIIAIKALFCDGWHLWPVPEGFLNAIEFWRPYVPILKLLGYSATLLLAGYNLSKYMDMQVIESLRTIRDRFNDSDKNVLHESLLCMTDRKPILPESNMQHRDDADDSQDAKIEHGLTKGRITNIVIYDYLGTIELGAIMLRKGLVSVDDFYNQFGYRIENVFRNKDIAHSINQNLSYYKNLIYARDLLFRKNLLNLND